MKQTILLSTLAFLASCVSASPTPTVQDDAIVDPRSIEKRAAITDAADVGYATQNGGYAHFFVNLLVTVRLTLPLQNYWRPRWNHHYCFHTGPVHGRCRVQQRGHHRRQRSHLGIRQGQGHLEQVHHWKVW